MPLPNPSGLTSPSVQITINNHIFTVNEDLLCRHSEEFRELLQGNRKVVEDCPVCTERIFDTQRTAWCKVCGQNLHATCIEKWFKSTWGSDKCPFCRGTWQSEHSIAPKLYVMQNHPASGESFGVCQFEDVMGIYLHWVDTGSLQLDEVEMLRRESRHAKAEYILTRLYFLGHLFRDQRLKMAVLNQIQFTFFDRCDAAWEESGGMTFKGVFSWAEPRGKTKKDIVDTIFASCDKGLAADAIKQLFHYQDLSTTSRAEKYADDMHLVRFKVRFVQSWKGGLRHN
ncbi:hypothetical protein K491DRAFT_711580 [Lophiostoma macrostomum CBS 122681]|uniref:RING-type domain-containing protein n=1 Tax=Lophiostoma macrostomum CBS 122681 TaxID=1314788 RepID=A0A6A6TLG5_9PLEO|nr:hypothetical protein K491DRAFT_711580 [Lophiostoma macrostomum CBS 122681]